MLKTLALAPTEALLNALIAQDPASTAAFAQLAGSRCGLQLRGLPWTLYCLPQANGRIQLFDTLEEEPDCLISGSPLDLWRARDTRSAAAALFSRHLQIHGDQALAQAFSQALGGLHLDWEELLAQLIGDTPSYLLGRLGSGLREGLLSRARQDRTDLGEVLTEEWRLTPGHQEFETQARQIERFRDDVERLAARVMRL